MTVQGERIFLRELTPEDASENYLQWLQDPEVNRYLEVRYSKQSLEIVRSYIASLKPERDRLFGIFLKDSEKHIGNIKVGMINPHHKFAEVGLLLGDKSTWGKGYATDAIGLATRFAFEQLRLNKVYASMYDVNVGSLKAFLANGFSETGRQKRHFYCEDLKNYVDCIRVEKLNEV